MPTRFRTYLIQFLLFVVTVITTTVAGAEWTWGCSFADPFRPMGWEQFLTGFNYSIPFLGILTIHELGHYFMAKYHKIDVTLPYYLPMWLGTVTGIGTMGAFIRIKGRIESRKKYFDVGVAGPLAGFVAAIALLYYGFTHLPSLDYLYEIHPEYKQFGSKYALFVYQAKQSAGQVALGDNLLFWFFKTYVASNPALVPHPYEMIHYPYLLAGYLSLFFTALNLVPIGQLDGGHILFGLIGSKNHRRVSPIFFAVFVIYSGLGLWSVQDFSMADDELFLLNIGKSLIYLYFLYLCFSRVSDQAVTVWMIALSVFLVQFGLHHFLHWEGNIGFLAFCFLLGRFLGIYHPETPENEPLNWQRKLVGWFSLIVFILCFTPQPFIVG